MRLRNNKKIHMADIEEIFSKKSVTVNNNLTGLASF